MACGSTSGIDVPPMWLVTPDNVRLYAVESGSGSVTIVLAHEEGSNLCGWLPYMKTLNAEGIRTLAVDLRGYGRSDISNEHPYAFGEDLATAVAQARADGATKVFLMGASMGGGAVIQNAASVTVDGRISLSGTRLEPGGWGIDDRAGVARITAPFLYVGSQDDAQAPLKEVNEIFETIRSRDKRKVLYGGLGRGWDFVESEPHGPRTRALVLSWLRAHS
jgi:pimeloyl-ACP methyl ester carboxylesterase